jgi:hypothetical protein
MLRNARRPKIGFYSPFCIRSRERTFDPPSDLCSRKHSIVSESPTRLSIDKDLLWFLPKNPVFKTLFGDRKSSIPACIWQMFCILEARALLHGCCRIAKSSGPAYRVKDRCTDGDPSIYLSSHFSKSHHSRMAGSFGSTPGR